jgi:HSP20 family protein
MRTHSLLHQREQFVSSFDRLFDEMLAQSFPAFSKEIGISFFEKQSYPRVDIIDTETEAVIEAELPGLNKNDIKIKITEGILTISGEKKSKPENDKVFIRRELKRSSFSRSFKFNEEYDLGKTEAEFKDGILILKVLKKNPEEKNEIQITIK